ncbi:MAG: malate dehydrogenase [Chromatiales bacterium]|jgi:malate dehydrogenase
MNKVAIVGAGRVGETTAQILAEKEICREVALLDIREDVAQGVALDICQMSPFFDFDTRVRGSEDPRVLADADLVVVTAGLPRKPGMSRSDVLEANVGILDSILTNVMDFAPDSKLLLVSNPVDVLTYHAWKKTGWDRSRVFGQAGVLDASRMANFIAEATGFSTMDITTLVLGGHGDTMVPLPRHCTINGIPVSQFLSDEKMQEIITRTRGGGAEILALRKNSSAYVAPGASVAAMVDAMSHNRKRILPSVAILQGEYGHDDIAMGVPCVLGDDGMEEVIELELNAQELAMLQQSVDYVREDLGRLAAL